MVPEQSVSALAAVTPLRGFQLAGLVAIRNRFITALVLAFLDEAHQTRRLGLSASLSLHRRTRCRQKAGRVLRASIVERLFTNPHAGTNPDAPVVVPDRLASRPITIRGWWRRLHIDGSRSIVWTRSYRSAEQQPPRRPPATPAATAPPSSARAGRLDVAKQAVRAANTTAGFR
jgi:hypothetical protein